MKSLPRRIVSGLQSFVRVLHAVWCWFPEVRPYTGPSSLTAKPGQAVRIFNGRVVVTTLRKR